MKIQAWRDDSVRKDNQKNDGYFSPEKIDLESTIKIRTETIERRVWTSGDLLGTCVIWCKGFPFWNLVIGVSGLRVEVIWGEDRIWRRQVQIWRPDNQCR